jgi:hypothetical protein
VPFLALGAVDLVALFVALAVLLVLFAFWVPLKVLQGPLNAAGHFSVAGYSVGVNIGDVVVHFIEDAIKGVVGAFDAGATAAGELFWALGVGVWHLVHQIVTSITDVKQSVVALAAHVGTVATGLTNSIDFVAGVVPGLISAAVDYLRAEAFAAINAVISSVDFLATVVPDLINTAIAHVLAITGAAIQQVGNSVDFLATVVPDLINTAIAHVLGETSAAIQEVGNSVDFLAGAVEAEVLGLTNEITGVASEVGPLVGAFAAGGIISLLVSNVAAITTEVDDCLKPLCDTVTPNAGQLAHIGKFLQGLEALGLAVGVTALFEEAVTDPGGLAHEVVTVMEDIGNPIITGIRDTVGV